MGGRGAENRQERAETKKASMSEFRTMYAEMVKGGKKEKGHSWDGLTSSDVKPYQRPHDFDK